MQFARVASFLFAFLTLGLFVTANPVVLQRDVSCATGISTLNATIAGIAARFQAVADNSADNQAFTLGLIEEIVEAIGVAGVVAKAIPPVSGTENPIASALGEVIQGMTEVFEAMVQLFPDLHSNIGDADQAMSELVTILDLLLADFVNILSVLVSQLANIFQVLGMNQLAGTLGF